MEAMALYALETAAAADDMATAADGLAVARRLQRARSLLSLATMKGFVEEYLAGARSRFRSLRHDIRNPLGTIKTAVSLMEDETIPADMRANPRFRAMVKRNASSIDAMIGRRLADSVTREEAFAWYVVSLADVVRTVRRDLREDAMEAHCDIVPDDGLPTVRTDALGAELLLRMVIGAVLRDAAPHTDIRVEPARADDASVVLVVHYQGGGQQPAELESGLALAEHLAAKMGSRVWRDDAIYLAIPTSPPGEEGENVGGAGEGAH
jgi:signal transduction histidine kinase